MQRTQYFVVASWDKPWYTPQVASARPWFQSCSRAEWETWASLFLSHVSRRGTHWTWHPLDVRLAWAEPGWAELSWTGLDWTVLDSTVLDWPG